MESKARYQGSDSLRLDRVVAELFSDFSRSQLKVLISAGDVVVDGVVINKANASIKPGSEIVLNRLPEKEPLQVIPQDLPIFVVYEDDAMLVINKQASFSVHPGAGNRDGTLVNALMHYFGEEFKHVGVSHRPGIVHRLDKDTTGVMVVAKTDKAHRILSKQFAEKTAYRRYQGLCLSLPRSADVFRRDDYGVIDKPLGRDPNHRQRFAVVEGGKNARTKFWISERFEYAVLVSFELETGRTHQIRVHAASMGAPLIGDPVYGKDAAFLSPRLRREVQSFGRQALHAEQLILHHPESNERMTFLAEVPDDFLKLVATFRGEA